MANIKNLTTRRQPPQKIGDKDAIITAKVVANYGDIGLTNQYYFDILSRFVIVMVESTDRVPTSNHICYMFFLVQRPRELWIDVNGGVQTSISNQSRIDNLGNTNRGSPSAYSVHSIPAINRPYRIGETIKIKRLREPKYFYDPIFSSKFPSTSLTDPLKNAYDAGYLTPDPPGAASISANAGQYAFVKTLPLFPHDGTRGFRAFGLQYSSASATAALSWVPNYETFNNLNSPVKADVPPFFTGFQYAIGLNKQTFEVFWRSVSRDVSTTTDPFILNTHANVLKVPNMYFWDSNNFATSELIFNCCAFEDMNVDNKAREASSDCMPLIVTNPSTYPTPKIRQAGTIKFDPTFTQITTT